jgi:hypothetical protein
MTSTTMVAGSAMTRGGRLRQLRGAVRRAQAASDARHRRWLETGSELLRLNRTLRRIQASPADPLLRDWCCCAEPPVLTGLAGRRDDPRHGGARLPVNECPRCGRDDAGGRAWTRTEPRPSAPPAGDETRRRGGA